MSTYNLDKMQYGSQFPTFDTVATYKVPISISGTVANGHSKYYGAGFTFTGDAARGDVSIQRPDTGLRAPFNAGTRLSTYLPSYTIYQYVSSETVRTSVNYPTPDTFQVLLYIDNQTGSDITLITQELDILIDFYFPPLPASV